jgi:hypothetical protein
MSSKKMDIGKANSYGEDVICIYQDGEVIAEETHFQWGKMARWAAEILQDPRRPLRIAMIGGGTGMLARLLVGQRAIDVDVYELLPEMARYALDNHNMPNSEWILGPYQEEIRGEYDYIAYDIACLEPELHILKRHAKKGGTIFISTGYDDRRIKVGQ